MATEVFSSQFRLIALISRTSINLLGFHWAKKHIFSRFTYWIHSREYIVVYLHLHVQCKLQSFDQHRPELEVSYVVSIWRRWLTRHYPTFGMLRESCQRGLRVGNKCGGRANLAKHPLFKHRALLNHSGINCFNILIRWQRWVKPCLFWQWLTQI